MTYVGIIASAVLHVGGLFLLLTARPPEPLIPLGSDTPVAVDIISLEEYNALTSRAPARSTLAALRTQPAAPRAPVADENPIPDTPEETPPADQPEPSVELAMRLPAVVEDMPPPMQKPSAPETSDVTVAPAPEPLELDADALRDRGVDPADLGPPEDVQVAVAPPVPEPPRGVYDAPVIDTTPDEPPKPAETEGEGEEARPAPEPEPVPEAPVETAEIDDPAPMATPFPVPKPRGSLSIASDEDRTPARVAEAPPPAPTPEPPAEPAAQQLTEAEMEAERRMMAALMEQMRANQPPSEADLRAAEEDARRKVEEEQQRQAELAALDEAERLKREAEDRARAEAAEVERLAEELANQRAREFAEQRAREAEAQLRARQEAAQRAQREAQEEQRRADIEAQRLAQRELDLRIREEEQRQRAARDLAVRRQQLAELNATVAPEARANTVLSAPVQPDNSFASGTSSLDRIFAAANVAATGANTGPSFGQGGNRGAGGASLTLDERQAVLNQLRRCWRVATFSENARTQIVILRAQIRQNGFINQATISVVSPNPIPSDYQVAVQRAQTALRDLSCQPFSLPANKYNAWRDIEIRFDPAQMVLQ